MLNEVDVAEGRLLSERSATLDRWKNLLTASVLICVLGAGLIAVTISRAFRAHIDELTESNAILDRRVAERTAALKTEVDYTRLLNKPQEIALTVGNFGTWD